MTADNKLIYPFTLEQFVGWLESIAPLVEKPDVQAVAIVASAEGLHIGCFKSMADLEKALIAPAAQPLITTGPGK